MLSLSLFCAGVAAAQTESTPAAPPNLRIMPGHWLVRTTGGIWPGVPPNDQAVPPDNEGRKPIDPAPETAKGTRVQRSYIYSTEIINTGPKDIRRMSWLYSSVDPKDHHRTKFRVFNLDTLRVNNKRALEINRSRMPTRVVDVSAPNYGLPEEGISIECLVFVDGSSWESPNAEPTACDKLRNWDARRRQ